MKFFTLDRWWEGHARLRWGPWPWSTVNAVEEHDMLPIGEGCHGMALRLGIERYSGRLACASKRKRFLKNAVLDLMLMD